MPGKSFGLPGIVYISGIYLYIFDISYNKEGGNTYENQKNRKQILKELCFTNSDYT